MKALLLITFGFIQFQLMAQVTNYEIDEKLYVSAFNGLNLRSEASLDSRVIRKLDHGTEVMVLGASDEIKEIDYRTSRWVHVQINQDIGYIFGGYLMHEKPMIFSESEFDCYQHEHLMNWINKIFEKDKICGTTSKQYLGKEDEPKTDVILEAQNYESLNSKTVMNFYEGKKYIFESLDISLNDMMNQLEYISACQFKYCGLASSNNTVNPIKNRSEKLYKIKYNYYSPVTVYKVGYKTIIEIETSF